MENNNSNFFIAGLFSIIILIIFLVFVFTKEKPDKHGGLLTPKISQKIEEKIDQIGSKAPGQGQGPGQGLGARIIGRRQPPATPPVIVEPPVVVPPPIIVIPPPTPPLHWTEHHRLQYIRGYEDGSHGIPIRSDATFYLKGYNDGRFYFCR